MPIVFIAYLTYTDESQSNNSFSDWLNMIVKGTDMGTFGFWFAAGVHVQIFALLFVMSFLAGQMKRIV
jgi:hypothetical protein